VTKETLTRNRSAIWLRVPSPRRAVSTIRCRRSWEWGAIAHLLAEIFIQTARHPCERRSNAEPKTLLRASVGSTEVAGKTLRRSVSFCTFVTTDP